ncbi:MAG: DNA-directed RNA polymerase subunit beta [Armatimonadetes bacterium]|nr:DNA-directed RNA polymerase subunit beta [Armatimonadota bacterium]
MQHSPSRTSQPVELPNLVSVQLESYKWFLEEGLLELFRNFSPIYDFTGQQFVELLDFTLGEPKYSIEECRDRDMTFEAPIRVHVRYGRIEGGAPAEMQESEVYLGDLPLMTDKGTFIINGRERVVVSQILRSPGVYFENVFDKIFRKGTPTGQWLETYLSNKNIFGAKVIPNEGPWIEIDTGANDVVTMRVGQGRALPITTFLRALENFPEACLPRYMKVRDALNRRYEGLVVEEEGAGADGRNGSAARSARIQGYFSRSPRVVPQPLVHPETGEILLQVGERITEQFLQNPDVPESVKEMEVAVSSPTSTDEDLLLLFGTRVRLQNPTREQLENKWTTTDIMEPRGRKPLIRAFHRIDAEVARRIEGLGLPEIEVFEVPSILMATLEHDPTHDKREALMDIYRKLRPGDPVTEEGARALISAQLYDNRRYDLARVGRYKLNKKLGLNLPLDVRTVTKEDFVAIIEYLLKLERNEGEVDEIDHLKNKRVRAVGELLQSQLRNGFLRMEKVAKERMTSMDPEQIMPQVILAIKPVAAAIKSFFGSSQLSQFMDQTNPLSELTHKRRLSALGPGGLTRQSATLEVRDVHDSHYGRICPIETPEGPNIGLISQLATYARVNEFGFIETPYRKVVNGKATDEIVYLTAEEEEHYRIAPGDTPLLEDGTIAEEFVQVRHRANEANRYPVIRREEVELMDVSPVQLVSVATALIPFLESDDAARALMGANMQKQAVPLLRSSAPIVKTGLERRAAMDSGALVIARRNGVVTKVTAEEIVVRTEDGDLDIYPLLNTMQSNQSTCITQKPIVNRGDRVRAGQVIADGPCSDHGELALGKNVLVCFVPWGGYNYEDAILISQRLVRDDVYSSIHIERYEVEARDTKLGPEEITRDIPNVGEDALKDLDEHGIIRIGAQVQPEDILVGKVQPKGQSELSAEERLIIAIFGKKAEETRDVSLRLPHGEKGKVIDVKVFSRFRYRCKECGHIHYFSKRPEDKPECERCRGELERISADDLPPGVNMLVRVYVAQKRKIMEGDKMAGRHGNKGVISKILPEEDMPFLPDGTPVDIVLNPLGVPSRMNIGQIKETHLGWAGHYFGTSYEKPAFSRTREEDILAELERMAKHVRRMVLQNYVNVDLGLNMQFHDEQTAEEMLEEIRAKLSQMPLYQVEPIASAVNAPPLISPLFMSEEAVTELQRNKAKNVDESKLPAPLLQPAPPEMIERIIERIRANTWQRCGIDERTGKCWVRDGLTGEPFDNPVTVGYIYMMKLAHLVDDKIHARSTGPYSLVTQQPLGGKAQFGGQRFGEMEVWALEAYGAAYTLQELLTIKSDDVVGRVKIYEAIVKGEPMMEPGIPESFKILVKELQSLGLKVTLYNDKNEEVSLRDEDDDDGARPRRSHHPQASAGGGNTR